MEHAKESKRRNVNEVETATSSENEQKTLHWLQSSLAEMNGEISDLNRSVNVSRQLQQQQETAGQLQLTRSDVAALQTQVADEAAHRQQINQSIQQVREDVQRLDQHQQLNAAQLDRLENNVSLHPFVFSFLLQKRVELFVPKIFFFYGNLAFPNDNKNFVNHKNKLLPTRLTLQKKYYISTLFSFFFFFYLLTCDTSFLSHTM